MNEVVEQIISYVLGAVLGILILALYLRYLGKESSTSIFFIASLIGILVSVAFVEYKNAKSLKKNNLVRNETIALITHEMRTGLTSASWVIQLILQKYNDSMSSEDKSSLNAVLESIHTTVMHSVNLLDISVLEIGKLSLSLEWVPLSKLEKMFSEILARYSVGANKKGIELIYSIKLDNAKQAEIDTVRLRIILENLLANAIQYTVKDKKMINIEIENTPKALTLKVQDTGIGIPKAEEKKIFKEFYRASNARAELPTGSGIGLYICKQYVKAHHGSIYFESKENEGATFFVSVPLKSETNVGDFLRGV